MDTHDDESWKRRARERPSGGAVDAHGGADNLGTTGPPTTGKARRARQRRGSATTDAIRHQAQAAGKRKKKSTSRGIQKSINQKQPGAACPPCKIKHAPHRVTQTKQQPLPQRSNSSISNNGQPVRRTCRWPPRQTMQACWHEEAIARQMGSNKRNRSKATAKRNQHSAKRPHNATRSRGMQP